MPNRPLTKDQYRSSIYIDFEGEGKSQSGELKLPHICGVFTPNLTGSNGTYEAVIFKPSWKAAKNGMDRIAKIQDFNDFFGVLYKSCAQQKNNLIFWTVHEERICQTFLEKKIFKKLQPYFHNLHLPAKRYANSRKIFGESSKKKSLEQFYQALFPNRSPQPSLRLGPAEICRRIDRICEIKNRWGQLTDKDKGYVKDLIKYNKGDCRSTWLIAKKIGVTENNEQNIRGRSDANESDKQDGRTIIHPV